MGEKHKNLFNINFIWQWTPHKAVKKDPKKWLNLGVFMQDLMKGGKLWKDVIGQRGEVSIVN